MNVKKNVLEFFRRGLVASGFGPIVLAVFYLILQKQGVLHNTNAYGFGFHPC